MRQCIVKNNCCPTRPSGTTDSKSKSSINWNEHNSTQRENYLGLSMLSLVFFDVLATAAQSNLLYDSQHCVTAPRLPDAGLQKEIPRWGILKAIHRQNQYLKL
jgi:hypothetical protein